MKDSEKSRADSAAQLDEAAKVTRKTWKRVTIIVLHGAVRVI